MRKKITSQSKTSNKEKRFTLMELITLSGKPLIYFLIFKGVKYWLEIETGTDFTINSCGRSNNQQEFIENNLEHEIASFEPLSSKGKLFPGGSVVNLKTK